MKVIAHEAIGVDFPLGFGASLAERFEKAVAVEVVLENVLAPVATVQDVVDGTGILNAEFGSHARRLNSNAAIATPKL